MQKVQLQYFITALLLSIGVFTLFNYDVPFIEWSNGSKIGTILVALLIYHNTLKNHNGNEPPIWI